MVASTPVGFAKSSAFARAEKQPLRAAFFMEQHLGHSTFYQNLRHFVEAGCEEGRLEAQWTEVSYEKPGSPLNYLPIPSWVRGPLIGRQQVQQGLKAPHEISFFNTQVPAVLAGRAALTRPYLLSTDITPLQYDQMAGYYHHLTDHNEPIRRFKRSVNVEIFQGAAYVLAWSDWVRNSLTGDYGVDPERVEVLPPGVSLELWQPERDMVARTLGKATPDLVERPLDKATPDLVERAPLRVLFVGGDFYRKGGDLLVEAFHQLPPGSIELFLVTHTPVQPGPGMSVYPNLCPNDPALRALYRSADVFALPSRAEAFGIAAIEAGAMALPVIATQIGGLSGIVEDGRTGLLIPPQNVGALVLALKQMAENPRLRLEMGQAARKRVETCFDAHKNAERILEIMEKVVNTNKKT